MANMERSWKVAPYHYCMRCYRKKHLSEMQWQLGLLLCLDWCYDKGPYALQGQREQYIARALNAGMQEELKPDNRLIYPATGGMIEEVIL